MLGFAGGPGDAPFDDKYIYQMLQTANQAMSIAAMAGAQQNMTEGAKSFATIEESRILRAMSAPTDPAADKSSTALKALLPAAWWEALSRRLYGLG